MRFFAKKRTLPKEYFYLEYSQLIGLRLEHYKTISSLLPFHTIDVYSEYVIISMDCPFATMNGSKRFFHFGKQLDLSKYKEKIKRPTYISALIDYHSDDFKDDFNEAETLSSTFNPCTLCEREIQCLFSPTDLPFEPKVFNSFKTIMKILQENGFTESKLLYHKYVAYSDEQTYKKLEPQTIGETLLLLILLIPLILFLLPWMFFTVMFDRKK